MSDYKNYHEPEKGDEVYTEKAKAGRRTYFFDVKETKGNDYYITITESRKKTNPDGSFPYDKCKLFVYKEDFDKFLSGINNVINYIKAAKPEFFESNKAGGHTISDEDFESL